MLPHLGYGGLPFGMLMPRPLVLPAGGGGPLPFPVARPKPLQALEGVHQRPGLPFSVHSILSGHLTAGQTLAHAKPAEERFDKEMDDGEYPRRNPVSDKPGADPQRNQTNTCIQRISD